MEIFHPHALCYGSDQAILWSFVLSDLTIFLSYMGISGALLWLMARHWMKENRWLATGFFLFINLCGWTHMLHAWGVFSPDFQLGAAVNIVTGLVSAVVCWVLIKALLKIDRVFGVADKDLSCG